MQLLSAGNMLVILVCYSDIQTWGFPTKVIDGPIKFLLFVEEDTRDYTKVEKGYEIRGQYSENAAKAKMRTPRFYSMATNLLTANCYL